MTYRSLNLFATSHALSLLIVLKFKMSGASGHFMACNSWFLLEGYKYPLSTQNFQLIQAFSFFLSSSFLARFVRGLKGD